VTIRVRGTETKNAQEAGSEGSDAETPEDGAKDRSAEEVSCPKAPFYGSQGPDPSG
jgi:hypothetical protein